MTFEDVLRNPVLRRALAAGLRAANLPSRDDVAALKRKLSELESMIDGLAARADADAGEERGPDEGGGA
ncbi:MAG TPA: hypothetical protein VML50_05190 [Anaeromyxobacter sp.]|nr:hypothetical protein [Anaeromyxobacter sp.]